MSLSLCLRADHTTTVRIRHKVVDGESVRALCCPGRELHLDFRDVAFVTASGLGQLVILHQVLQAQGGRLTVGRLGAYLQEVFEVTHLTRVLHVCP